MRDNRLFRRITPILLASGLALAVVIGPNLSAVAQGKPSPAEALKTAVAKAKQLQTQLSSSKPMPRRPRRRSPMLLRP